MNDVFEGKDVKVLTLFFDEVKLLATAQGIPQGNAVFTVSPGIIKDNYVSKDYEKGELILCPSCTRTVGQVLNLMGVKRADNMALLAAA